MTGGKGQAIRFKARMGGRGMGGVGYLLAKEGGESYKRSCMKADATAYESGWRHSWFLITELVKRDFKSRYNRSVLGMLWCLLQPTLTMALLYFVFSFFFKNSIPNFPVYLISGIVFYQFFTETTTSAMLSIQANAGLIAKVKIPLWTYPTTQGVASLVNFALALVPLLAVVLATRTPLRGAAWLLGYSTLTMLAFSLGVGFFLSSMSVLFHDVVFLWQFACLLAMYATPVFYPDTMLLQGGGQLMLYLNPLYHYIHFSRTLLIEGAVPGWKEFAACALFAGLALAGGVWVFHSQKNKFVQYL